MYLLFYLFRSFTFASLFARVLTLALVSIHFWCFFFSFSFQFVIWKSLLEWDWAMLECDWLKQDGFNGNVRDAGSGGVGGIQKNENQNEKEKLRRKIPDDDNRLFINFRIWRKWNN